MAKPPLYRIKKNKAEYYLQNDEELLAKVFDLNQQSYSFAGLNESEFSNF